MSAKNRRYHEAHRDEILARQRARYAAKRRSEIDRCRAYFVRNRDVAAPRRRIQARGRWRKTVAKSLGMTVEALYAIRDAQGGLCALCRTRPATRVDHDHATNVVRGWLCNGCNVALGVLGDSPERIAAVYEYTLRGRPAKEDAA